MLKFLPNTEIINLCINIAQEKSGETMDQNQDGEKRSSDEKIIRQFEGCLAEFAVACYFCSYCGISKEQIKVYDALRNDYKYKISEEYDLKLSKLDKLFEVEVRNSKSFKTTLDECIEGFQVILRYVNSVKKTEELSDIFVRPILQYVDKLEKLPKDTISDFENNKVNLYLVGAATKKSIEGKVYEKNNGVKTNFI